MMKKIVLIHFLVISLIAFSQGETAMRGVGERSKEAEMIDVLCEENPDDCYPEACHQGIANAVADVKNKDAKYYFFEHPSPDFTSYLWVLDNRYDINPIFVEKMLKMEAQCYNNTINEAMIKQHGAKFWTKVSQQADSLNNLGMTEAEMWKFIYCNLNYLDKTASQAPKVVVFCNIDETGKMIETRIIKSFSTQYDQEALRVVAAIPKWKPIAQKLHIPIIFDASMKKDCEN